MSRISMNSENSKISDAHRLGIHLRDKIDLRRDDNCVALSNLSTYYTCKNFKIFHRKRTLKISGTSWDEKFDMPNGFYLISYM